MRCCRRTRASRTFLAGLLALAACACDGFAGVADAGQDGGSTPDAGPWEPAFAPRVIFSDPSIVCPPGPQPGFVAVRAPADRGDVLWAYSPRRDPAFVERATSLFLRVFNPAAMPLAIAGDGSVVLTVLDAHMVMGVSSTGEFSFLDRSWASGEAPQPAALAPLRSLHVAGGFVVDEWHPVVPGTHPGGGSIPRAPDGNPALAYPVPLPGWDGSVFPAMPALLADGSIVFAPTRRALAIACVEDGRIRTVIEHDPLDWGPAGSGIVPSIHALRAGGFVVAAAGVLYRFDGNGSLLATSSSIDPRRHVAGVPLGTDDDCGVALYFRDRIEWRDLEDLTLRETIERSGELLGWLQPTAECGLLEIAAERGVRIVRRHHPSGDATDQPLPTEHSMGVGDSWLLEDDGVLLLSAGREVTVMNADGSLRWSIDLEQDVVGEAVMPGAALAPDGVLYFITDSGVGIEYRIVAVATGTVPRYPRFGAGLDWGLRNAGWALPSR